MKLLIRSVFLLLFVISPLNAQEEMRFELSSINFDGNNSIPDKAILSVLRSKETPNGFYQFINKYSSLGAPPEYIDFLLVQTDLESIQAL